MGVLMKKIFAAALQDLSSTQVGTLTVGDMVKIAERVSIAEQKLHYVQKVRMASLMHPGAGQFMTGDAVGGALFLAGGHRRGDGDPRRRLFPAAR